MKEKEENYSKQLRTLVPDLTTSCISWVRRDFKHSTLAKQPIKHTTLAQSPMSPLKTSRPWYEKVITGVASCTFDGFADNIFFLFSLSLLGLKERDLFLFYFPLSSRWFAVIKPLFLLFLFCCNFSSRFLDIYMVLHKYDLNSKINKQKLERNVKMAKSKTFLLYHNVFCTCV